VKKTCLLLLFSLISITVLNANTKSNPIGHLVAINPNHVQYGVGTLIEPNLVVTATHVVTIASKAPEAIVFELNGTKYLGKIVASSEEEDIAFVQLATNAPEKPAAVRKTSVAGKELVVNYLANLEDNNIYTTTARPSACKKQTVWGELTDKNLQLVPGNSGSPVFVEGELYGILKARQLENGFSAWYDRIALSGKLFPNQVIAITTVALSEDSTLRTQLVNKSWLNMGLLLPIVGFVVAYFGYKRKIKPKT